MPETILSLSPARGARLAVWDRVGMFAAISSATEIGLGGFLHALHVPLTGHFLANFQGVVLASFLDRRPGRKPYVFFVSATGAALKSLSPMGRKLRPMLGIFMQGLLFHGAVNVLGCGALGVVMGQSLIGAWCSAQTFLFQYVFFGQSLLLGYGRLLDISGHYVWLPTSSPLAWLGAWIALNGLVSAGVGFAAYRFAWHPAATTRISPMAGHRSSCSGETDWACLPSWFASIVEALAELRRPSFVLPFAFVLIFAWFGRNRWDVVALLALRGTAVAFLCFLIVKRIDFIRLTLWLRARGWGGPARALDTALAQLPARSAALSRRPVKNPSTEPVGR
ncbi:MAG: hypothetical protein HY551_01665 [Elusimicrobia bacterium]|nr:hypothetical protein [Elusimicrobiota bacterium]